MEASICQCGDHAWLNLNDGHVALVSARHAPLLTMWPWKATECHGNYYVRRFGRHQPTVGRREMLCISMHKVICPCVGKRVVDHKNGNGLDNRENNLQPISNLLNKQKQRKKPNATSSYKGVSYYKKKWRTTLQHEGKQIFVGYFRDEEVAARAYDRMAYKIFGPGVVTNFPLSLDITA